MLPNKSWKTTLAGLLGILASAITLVIKPLMDGDAATAAEWGKFWAIIAPAAGLLFARDDNRSSEAVGAKK